MVTRYNSEDINWGEMRARINDQDDNNINNKAVENDMSTSADIDWEELRRKVEDDFDKELNSLIDGEDSECGDIDCKICEGRCGSQKDCIGLPTKDGSDTYDFADEHGLLDEDGNMIEETEEEIDPDKISAIAWNTNTKPVQDGDFLGIMKPNMFYPKSNFDYTGVNKPNVRQQVEKEAIDNDFDDVQCKHFLDASEGIGEVYIYPINDKTRMCLCKTCNANLASKMLEQLALETFI
jgi:hypothetical protein